MKRRRPPLLPVLLLILIAPGASARPLTLEEALARALAANPRLRAAKLEVAVAKAQTSQAIGRHFGEVDFLTVYNAYDDARLVRPIAGPLNPATIGSMPFDQNQVHFGVTWQLPLLTPGLVYGDLIARDREATARATSAHAVAEVRYSARAAYRNILVLAHALDATAAYEAALDEDRQAADLKVRVEAWPPVDAQKVGFTLEGARARKAALQAQRTTAEGMLAALMGEDPPPDGFQVADLPDETVDAEVPSLDELQGQAQSGRNDLEAARGAVRAAEHRRDMSRAAFLPEIGVQGSYLRHAAPSVSGTLPTLDFALVVKFPILVGATRWFAMDETGAELGAARERERARELEVATQVSAAAARVQAARAQLRSGRARRELGREVARVEHLKLLQGTGRMEDYLAARAQEVEGEAAYWEALYGLQTERDYLDFATARGGQP